MNKIITLLLLFLIVGTGNLFSQSKYSAVRIDLQQTELSEIASLGIDVTEGFLKKGVFLQTDLSDVEISRLQENGITVKILIDDVSAFYALRAASEKDLKINRDVGDWPVPENWDYGSMGGFYTLEEVYAELDSMTVKYPELINERQAISEDTITHDGRELYWIRISDNPGVDEEEPEVLYTGLHHAREPMSIQQMIFYMWYLLENYATDEGIQRIVDNTELYFVPVINPDGYAYNQSTNPNGGGMWRKNRRNNGDGTYGVDPNRNYGYMWGLNNSGSSPDPGDETYRGPAPFSEPEIKNVRDFCVAHEFQIALNYHSYSNLLLTPWGYTTDLPPDNDLFMAYAAIMTAENNYTYGPGSSTIYPTNGGSDDWMYGEQDTKNAIWSATPEVGGSSDGFWPSPSRIIPLCQAQMWQNLMAARLVGNYGVMEDISPMVTDDMVNQAIFKITRLGMFDTEAFTVSVEPLDEYIAEVSDPMTFNDLEILETSTDSISYTLDAGIEGGTIFRYLISIDNGDFVVSDTVVKVYGTEVVVFEDDGETTDNWTSAQWGLTDEAYTSPEHSVTDSPYGNYGNDVNSNVTFDTIINLTDVSMATLRFRAKWDIEKGYDYVQIMAKDAGSSNWVALHGNYSSYGNYYLDNDEPVYDGVEEEWISEEISLQDFSGEEIMLRFTFYSDGSVKGDGFYFDDLSVSVISIATGIKELREKQNNIFISEAYPNPASSTVKVSYNLMSENKGSARFELFNTVGNRVLTKTLIAEKGVVNFRVDDLPHGVYYYRIVQGNRVSGSLKIVRL